MSRVLLATTAAAALIAVAIVVPLSTGSSHREAPNIMLDPTADNTDVYAFVANDATNKLTMVSNWIPNEDPANGPNFFRFDDRARYYINIDNNGDGVWDVRYLFKFKTIVKNPDSALYAIPPVTKISDQNLNVVQRYDLFRQRYRKGKLIGSRRIGHNIPVGPPNIGPKTMPNYDAIAAGANKTLRGGVKVFAGQRDDPFFVDLGATFDSLNIRKLPGGKDQTGNQGGGKDDFSGMNIFSTILQVPQKEITRDGKPVSGPTAKNAVVGVWSSTDRRRLQVTNTRFGRNRGSRGKWVQVSRLGNPLVNEVVIPLGHKDEFNRTQPSQDAQRFGAFVVQPQLATVLNLLFNVGAPTTNRTDIVQALLQGIPNLNQLAPGSSPLPTDTLKINMGIPPTASGKESRFGVIGGDNAGFPNGRRLFDDVVDIEVQVIAGFLKGNKVPLGDGVDQNDTTFLTTFPYVSAPHSGFDNAPATRIEPVHPPTPAGGP